MSTTTSNASTVAAIEARRVRLERLLQSTMHDFSLRFRFGDADRLGRGQMQLRAPDASLEAFVPFKAAALHLLGHYIAESQQWAHLAGKEQERGQPGFLALWHALEDARVDNRLVDRWPGMRRAFESRLLPNLGGSLVRLMSLIRQLELGLYLEGRRYKGAQYDDRVRAGLDAAAADIAYGAAGATAEATLTAMRCLYPKVAGCLAFRSGDRVGTGHADNRVEERPTVEGNAAEPDGLPEIELTDDRVEVGLMGRERQVPEWYRPGSAPWFERGLGQKAVHPSAIRGDRQTIVPPPPGDLTEYRALWADVQREAGFLAMRMANRLRDESYLRYGGQYRSGKLHTAKLWKQRMGGRRLFERPVAGERSTAFMLLVDESASMKGQDKYRSATKTAILLGETLTQMSVPFEIIGFTTADFEARAAMRLGLTPAHEYRTVRCSALEHRIYKPFDEPYPLVRGRMSGIEPRHNNWDEEHLLFAFRRLQARREWRKVMIVISDGQPNGDANHLITTISRLESRGCRIIGVGIGADFVRGIYRSAIVVSDFRQLAEELLEVLARELGRGFSMAAA